MKAASPNQETAALREEIDQTRADLSRTVQALAERVDIPTRVRAARARAVERARHSPVPWLVLAGVAAAAAVAGVILVVRSRRG